VQALAERYLVQPELPAMRAALAIDTGRGAMRDPKTLLQERVQAEGTGRLRYVDVAQTGPAHQRIFTVEAQLENEDGLRVLAAAEGASKKEAQQRAAEIAMEGWTASGGPPAGMPEAKQAAGEAAQAAGEAKQADGEAAR
jgi:ribonuclease-3